VWDRFGRHLAGHRLDRLFGACPGLFAPKGHLERMVIAPIWLSKYLTPHPVRLLSAPFSQKCTVQQKKSQLELGQIGATKNMGQTTPLVYLQEKNGGCEIKPKSREAISLEDQIGQSGGGNTNILSKLRGS